ncbi:VirB6 protein [Cupriavidus basilensis OR16]|uniref:VirB6 protein n=1 Tax=Cupriavidus basilensis OR16 TaxID=1127483 RepID=H1RZU8_9BURK|nr:type IV secretion system protein [Cupriavidus basilensis]EHP44164.1 VirB6 protein [Cupriavidus basilensis OR16]
MSALTIAGLLNASDGVTDSFLSQTYPALANAVSTPVYLVAVLYWVVYGYKIYAGHAPLALDELLAKAIMTSAVFATLNWAGMGQMVYQAFSSFMNGAASTIMAGKPTDQMLDALFSNAMDVAAKALNVSLYQTGVLIVGGILWLVTCALFVVAVAYTIIAKFGLAITMVLLPLFVGFLLFAQTRQWFMNWVSKMLTHAFLYILVVAIVRLGFVAFGDALDTAGTASGPLEAVKISFEQVAYLLIVEGILIVFIFCARGWAAQLASGASASSGALLLIARSLKTPGGRK